MRSINGGCPTRVRPTSRKSGVGQTLNSTQGRSPNRAAATARSSTVSGPGGRSSTTALSKKNAERAFAATARSVRSTSPPAAVAVATTRSAYAWTNCRSTVSSAATSGSQPVVSGSASVIAPSLGSAHTRSTGYVAVFHRWHRYPQTAMNVVARVTVRADPGPHEDERVRAPHRGSAAGAGCVGELRRGAARAPARRHAAGARPWSCAGRSRAHAGAADRAVRDHGVPGGRRLPGAWARRGPAIPVAG